MKQNYRLRGYTILTLAFFLGSSLASTSLAATTEEKLNACDAALYAKIKEADLCNLGVQLRSDELSRVTKENAELRSRNTAWYNNPFLWGAIGSILGVYAGARAVR